MNDRAEQAKALIAEALEEIERAGKSDGRIWYGLVSRLTAALTASEAEVTRLETGIAEANKRADKNFRAYLSLQGMPDADIERALSQPATDTNGAHDA